MKELIKISLDNEMDLILAHRRTMKIGELCGLSIASQTSFATAVSEIARCSIASGSQSFLKLGIATLKGGRKEIVATVTDTVNIQSVSPQAFKYAKRLMGRVDYEVKDGIYTASLYINLPYPGLITENKISGFIDYFDKEAPLSPYDEIRKKNIQLIELSEKLTESENKYRQLTDNLPQLIFTLNNKSEITFTNKWFNNYLGNNIKSFNRTALKDIFHKDDVSPLIKEWDVARKNQSRLKIDIRIKLKNNYVWHLLSIVPQISDDGEVLNWIGFLVDIDTQKLVEETLKNNQELKAAKEQLLEYNKELSLKNSELERFAYIASHDLQEPLRKIKFFISLAERNITPEQKEGIYYDKISTSANRMSILIRDILNYSKVSGESKDFVPVDMNEVLQEVLDDFDYAITERKARINSVKLPVIKGIPIQINQMFYNLISNSLKFSVNDPEIKIKYDLVRNGHAELKGVLSHNTDYHKISLQDNGIGIDEQYSKRIFTIFQRLHNHAEFEGTGIGLALCKKIAENHHGTISFKSTLGKGTTFEVYLPA